MPGAGSRERCRDRSQPYPLSSSHAALSAASGPLCFFFSVILLSEPALVFFFCHFTTVCSVGSALFFFPTLLCRGVRTVCMERARAQAREKESLSVRSMCGWVGVCAHARERVSLSVRCMCGLVGGFVARKRDLRAARPTSPSLTRRSFVLDPAPVSG